MIIASHGTLTGTTVESVTLTDGQNLDIEVLNRAGSTTIYVSYGGAPADPSDEGADTVAVPAGSAITLPGANTGGDVVVKLIGNGNAYSVMAF